jgi:hypothetical protein
MVTLPVAIGAFLINFPGILCINTAMAAVGGLSDSKKAGITPHRGERFSMAAVLRLVPQKKSAS